jgi:hypothetical protein
MKGKKPRILLVQPTTVHLDGTPHKTRWRLIMGLMIPLMAVYRVSVLPQNATQLRFVEHDQVIEAFAPNRSDEAFDVAVLPR